MTDYINRVSAMVY